MAPPVLEWQAGTVTAIRPETRQTKSFTISLPRWMAHRAGMHYDVRLTAPDGYQTERSYSIASPPEQVGMIQLTVERIEDGEVSPYLHDVVVAGDQLEVRGPIGGYFVWEVALGGPLLLIGGGSGVVPLMADDVIYRDELDALAAGDRGFEAFFTFTRQAPPGWTGYRRRIDAAMLTELIKPFGTKARVYVCGPTLLVEAVATALVQMALPIEQIRTERFGPTGV